MISAEHGDGMAAKIKDFEDLMNDIDAVADYLDSTSIAYGYPTEKKSKNDPSITVAQVAYYTQTGKMDSDGGWERVPRKFMTVAEILAEEKGMKHLEQISDAVMGGYLPKTKTIQKAIAKDLGETVQEAILSNVYAPLKPSTIERKGHATMLIETGDMYDSAKGMVVDNKDLEIDK
ncbi:neck protein [Vibrio phage 1.084.O._10N.261.49.F5]|nr:neck protein [Vibrio phage 1.084.O._10N.261.49.F5]